MSRSALVLLAVACARTAGPPAGLGRRVAAGPAGALTPSPDGANLAFLDRCARPPVPDLPPSVMSCDLELIPSAGGSPRRLAEGVTNLPGGLSWSDSGKWLAALADHDYGASAGTLVVAAAGAGPTRVAPGVTFFGFRPGGEALVFVARGRLMILEAGEAEPRAIPGAEGVATFEFAPAQAGRASRILLAARRSGAAGGDLLALSDWKGPAARVAAGAGDYGFAPDGRLAFTARGRRGLDLFVAAGGRERPTSLGRNVQSFAFARHGSAIAFLAGVAPGRPGELYAAAAGGRPERMGGRVGEYRWAAAAPRLAWLQDFDAHVRAGTLALGGPGARPRLLGRNVTAWSLSPDGARIAFLEHATAGGYSVDLKLGEADGETGPRLVARGAFGFDFAPEGDWLYYRSLCARNGEACDLDALAVSGPKAGTEPRRIAGGMKSFDFDRRRPGRLLVTWARKDLLALDLAVWEEGKLVPVDSAALPGSAQFLGPDARRMAYVIADPKRAGVYVAEIP